MYTYPTLPKPAGDLSAEQVHRLLKAPGLIARRLESILDHKFIADYLLSGRFTAQGGAVLYETGEPLFAADSPEAIAPGGEYPLTVMTAGELAAAKTTKWGEDSEVTDEAISRLLMQPVDKTLNGLANSMVRHVDSVALAVIASKLTATFDVTGSGATGAWTTAEAIISGVLMAKATVDEAGAMPYDANTVVLQPLQFAKVVSKMVASDMLPRESGNFVTSGVVPDVLGLTWTTSKYAPFSDPLLVDNTRLGGMADENIQSPGYANRDGLEVKVMRVDDRDAYRPRARRVTVPVVTDPAAGIRIVNTGV